MRIDRNEFMRLCAAITLMGCPSGRDAGAEAPVPAVEVEPGSEDVAQVELDEEDADAPDPCPGEVPSKSACARVSPACEGLPQECPYLAEALRPPIAAAWSECFAKARPPKCRDKRLGACMREAIENSCARPEMLERCEKVMVSCRKAGIEPKYTLTQCGQVASAVNPSNEPSGWERVDWERMGPSSAAESCSLEYVLPYQPYGFSWR